MPRIHETAIIDSGVEIGQGTSVWDNVHIREGARVGTDCIVGEKTCIGPGVVVGDLVKLNTSVYLCTGVTLERGVMVSAHVVFTNDRYPRASTPDLVHLRSSEADESTHTTIVREGATIGAAATVGPGIQIGRFSMVGMGSVVTRSVPDFNLVVGNPAVRIGYVCRCGSPLETAVSADPDDTITCGSCGRRYRVEPDRVIERDPEDGPGA
jgi:UDP-2-acetamido-3-amino-2,3-dideoxy-glucuronate N-acetyltransferase